MYLESSASTAKVISRKCSVVVKNICMGVRSALATERGWRKYIFPDITVTWRQRCTSCQQPPSPAGLSGRLQYTSVDWLVRQTTVHVIKMFLIANKFFPITLASSIFQITTGLLGLITKYWCCHSFIYLPRTKPRRQQNSLPMFLLLTEKCPL